MTKAELVDYICDQNQSLTKKAGAEIVDTIFAGMKDSIREEGKFAAPGFGTFTVRQRKARTGVNPRTKEPIQIPASQTVGFKPAKAFKESLP